MRRRRSGGCAEGAGAACGLAVLAACMALVAAAPREAYWINDCGNKALVAKRLLETRFTAAAFTRPGAALDPDGRWFPIPPPFAVAREGRFVSAYPPALPALAAAGLALLGPRGLRLPAALGTAASAALFALWAAPALGRRAACAGALLLGLASPLFFYGVTVWEHSLTVALSLSAWLLLSQPVASRWLCAGALVAAATWLREELVLMAVAVLAAALLRRQPLRLSRAFAAGAALLLSALLVFNQRFYGSPLGGHVALNLGLGAAGAAFAGPPPPRLTAVAGLLGGFGHSAGEEVGFALLGLLLPAAGALAPARLRAAPGLAAALVAAGLLIWGCAALRMLGGENALQELVLHNGLLLQWPMWVLAGLGARRSFEDPAFAPVRTAALAGLLFGALVLATGIAWPSRFGVQVGAGVHWGPRVLLPALPALVLFSLAAVAGRAPAVRAAWAALALAGVLSSALSSWFLLEQERDGALFAEKLRALPPQLVMTPHPMLAQHLAMLWGEKIFLLTPDTASLQGAAAAARGRGASAFLFVGGAGQPLASPAPGVACRAAFQYRGPHLSYLDLDVYSCAFAPSPAPSPGRAAG